MICRRYELQSCADAQDFDAMLEKVASFSPDENHKTLKLVVMETTTDTVVGFIRFGSPLI